MFTSFIQYMFFLPSCEPCLCGHESIADHRLFVSVDVNILSTSQIHSFKLHTDVHAQ